MNILDSLRQSATDAATEAQRLVRAQRQQLHVTALKRDRDRAALALGNRAVEKLKAGTLQDPELMSLLQPVLDLEARVGEAERELESLKQKERTEAGTPSGAGAQTAQPEAEPSAEEAAASEQAAPSAGGTTTPEEDVAQFSGSQQATTGAAEETVETEEPPTREEARAYAGTKTCPNCGASIPQEAEYCISCGARVSEQA